MTPPIATQGLPVETVILPPVRDVAGLKVRRALPSAHRRMVGPFIFLDHTGPMAFGPGEGPGIAPHPHIGLSTLTYLLKGEMIHRDSAGHVETLRPRDVNWMTAGRGIAHSERSPDTVQAKGGSFLGQQIWVALPRAAEEMSPTFAHHPERALPLLEAGGVAVTVVAGEAYGKRSPVRTYSDLMFLSICLEPGARLQLPSDHVERAAYVISGEVEVVGQSGAFGDTQLIVFRPGAEVVLKCPRGARLTLLGGEPFPEPRHIFWNFVSSTKERIEQAKDEWRSGRFPKIPGETDFVSLPPDPPGYSGVGR
jgi:redox-sensitive bicupin YhaK (pirin superfamily)